MLTMQADNIGASAWMDTKIVTIMYSGVDPAEHCTVLRRQKDRTRSPFPCPAAIGAYNQHMGGVDRGDQLRGYYAKKMKCRKYYKYIFNFLVGVSLTNAFILFRASHPNSKITLKKFHELLATLLIGDYCSRRRAGRVSYPIQPLPLHHFPTKVPSANTERKRGRCSLCQESHHRKDTQWFCVYCGVWLCHPGTADDCFLLWHRRRLSQSHPPNP